MANFSVRVDSSLDANAYDDEFLRTELRTGLMFSKIALESRYEAKRDRNCARARRAYDALLHFMPKVSNHTY